jgi:arylsulfatase A-like enzyme
MQPWPFTFWLGEGQRAPEPIAGDGCELIMNRTVPFIESAVEAGQPFFATVWFFTPHSPVAAGPEARESYAGLTMREQHWFGAISAIDGQISRLLETLRRLRVDENTLVWFCSDNGPSWVHELNSAGPLRGKKSELYEGGIRVPAIVRWPAGLAGQRTIAQPLSTLDFLPTLLAVSGISGTKLPPLDGENVLSVLREETKARQRPLFFDYPYRDVTNISWVPTKIRQTAVIDGPWKIISLDDRKTFALYNLEQDVAEKNDLIDAEPERARRLRDALDRWTAQCAKSLQGADY